MSVHNNSPKMLIFGKFFLNLTYALDRYNFNVNPIRDLKRQNFCVIAIIHASNTYVCTYRCSLRQSCKNNTHDVGP